MQLRHSLPQLCKLSTNNISISLQLSPSFPPLLLGLWLIEARNIVHRYSDLYESATEALEAVLGFEARTPTLQAFAPSSRYDKRSAGLSRPVREVCAFLAGITIQQNLGCYQTRDIDSPAFDIEHVQNCSGTGQQRRSRTIVTVAAASRGSQFKVLITGSTKGLGRALAEEFVLSGDAVVVTSRSDARVSSAVKQLSSLKSGKVKGTVCDVSKPNDVRALAKYASEQMGGIDIWINNAGTNGYTYKILPEVNETDLVNIVETNVLGVMLCCQQAIQAMRKHNNVGHVFNMDGAGADGSPTPRFAAYGATKRGLAQLSKSIQAELAMSKINNVCIHNLSPGMVTTELLLSEPPQVVAKFLVPKIRKIANEMQTPGKLKATYVKFLTKSKAYSRIFSRLLFGSRKNRFLEEK